MNRYLIISLLAMLIITPSALADGNPTPGQRLCYHYSDGTEANCSEFPANRYIYKDVNNPFLGVTRDYMFDNGITFSIVLQSQSLTSFIPTVPALKPWGWSSTTASTVQKVAEPTDPSLVGSDGRIFRCKTISIKGKKFAVTNIGGITCAKAAPIISASLTGKKIPAAGWKCYHKMRCQLKHSVIELDQITKGESLADVPQSDRARFCGTYQIDQGLNIWAHDCSDVDQEMIDGLIATRSGNIPQMDYACGFNLGQNVMRCATAHGCVLIRGGSYSQLDGIEYYGASYAQMSRNSCTQIDFV